MSKRILRALVLIGFALAVGVAPARADTILYSTLGPAFLPDGWKTHGGVDEQISVAMPFDIGGSTDATIHTIEVGFSFDPTGEDFVEADVLAPADGQPGAFVFGVSFDLPFSSTPDRLLTMSTNIRLAPGSYFLSLRTSGDIVGTWWETNAPFFGGWTSTNEGPWIEQPGRAQGAFRLSGSQRAATPEPASLISLTSGLVALWLRKRVTACTRRPTSPRARPPSRLPAVSRAGPVPSP